MTKRIFCPVRPRTGVHRLHNEPIQADIFECTGLQNASAHGGMLGRGIVESQDWEQWAKPTNNC
jgi:hypothetical protein